MKKFLLLLVLLPNLNFATGVSVVENTQGKWDVYYISPTGQKFFIHQYSYQVSNKSGDGQALFYQTRGNVFSILYTCIADYQDSCIRYVNIKTNQVSPEIQYPALLTKDPYSTLVGPIDNLNQNVVLIFNYPQDIQYTITPIFQTCKKPFVYKIPGGNSEIPASSIGPAPGTAFLNNGNLTLNMMMAPNSPSPYQQVTIPIDYQKLYQNCLSNS